MKENLRKQGFNEKSDMGRSKQIFEVNTINGENEFVKGLSWIMYVDSFKFPKNEKPPVLKKFYNKVLKKDAIARTTSRFYIEGNINKTNVRIINKFGFSSNCN